MKAFNLYKFVIDTPVVEVAAEMAKSVAWRADVALLSKTRELYKQLRQHIAADGDSLSDLNNALAETQFIEQCFEEPGLERDAIEQIKQLVYFRTAWHDLADELVSKTFSWDGTPKKYKVPEIEELFFKSPNMKVSGLTQRRIEMSATKAAQTFGIDKQLLINAKQEREKQNLAEISTALKDMAPGCWELYKLIMKGAADSIPEGSEKSYFFDLSKDMQHMFIQSALSAADAAEQYAIRNRSLSDTEFGLILAQCISVKQRLKDVVLA